VVEPLTGKLATVLETRRSACNAAFLLSRRQYRRLEGAAFMDYLRSVVAPLVEAATDPDPVAMALYDLSLQVVGAGLVRDATPLWTTVLPTLVTLLEKEPQRVSASLTNGAVNLSRTPGARPDEWLAILRQWGPACPDVDTLLALGQVAAWRAGMAHYRVSALQVRLPEALCHAVLGCSAAALQADPWSNPASSGPRRLQIVGRVGGFRGFGGLFLRPAVLHARGDALFVTDGEDSWLVHADRFGAVLTRAPLPQNATQGALTLDAQGEVQWGSLRQRMPFLANATSWASTSTTLAAAVPRSHWVYLVAARVG
jgi:hypothetical protein